MSSKKFEFFFTGELQRPAGSARKLKSYDHWIVNSRCSKQTQSVQTMGENIQIRRRCFSFFFYSFPVNKQVEISLFCTRHLIGWIWKCWNLLFQFCLVIGLHCLGGPPFSSRSVKFSGRQLLKPASIGHYGELKLKTSCGKFLNLANYFPY